jgi:hypothetical protein
VQLEYALGIAATFLKIFLGFSRLERDNNIVVNGK